MGNTANGSNVLAGINAQQLQNVPLNLSGISSGQALIYDGTNIVGGSSGGAINVVATITLGSNAADIDFTGLPTSGYSKFIVDISWRSAAAATQANLRVQFNSDTSANYWYALMINQTPAGGGGWAFVNSNAASYFYPATGLGNTATAHTQTATTIEIFNPNSTTVEKVCRAFLDQGDGSGNNLYSPIISSGGWNNYSSPITEIVLINDGGDFLAGTKATVYGVQ